MENQFNNIVKELFNNNFKIVIDEISKLYCPESFGFEGPQTFYRCDMTKHTYYFVFS